MNGLCWLAVVIRWSFRTILGGEKAMGCREMKVGSWVRLGGNCEKDEGLEWCWFVGKRRGGFSEFWERNGRGFRSGNGLGFGFLSGVLRETHRLSPTALFSLELEGE